jgi:hypothetical protein
VIGVRFHVARGVVDRGPFEAVTLGGIRADVLVADDEILARREGELWELPDGTGVGAMEFVSALAPERYAAICAVVDRVKTDERSLDTDEYASQIEALLGGEEA